VSAGPSGGREQEQPAALLLYSSPLRVPPSISQSHARSDFFTRTDIMSHRLEPSDPPPEAPRRGFLAQLATAAVAVAAGGLVRPSRVTASEPPNRRPDML